MRTTLDIDDDILIAAKALARSQNLSAGQLVSRLLRRVLTGQVDIAMESDAPSVAGFRPFTAGKAITTNDVVNRLRDAEGV
jgi:hypothetical protein